MSSSSRWSPPTRLGNGADQARGAPTQPPPAPTKLIGRRSGDNFAKQQPVARRRCGRLILIAGRGGGVGKSTAAAHAADACGRAGLRTVCIDEKSQGDLRSRLGFGDDRTLLQIADYWDGDADTLDQWIVTNDEVKCDWIVGPDTTGDDYDDDLISDELYGRLVDVLLDAYDVVIVDTHPLVIKRTSQFYTTWLPRLASDVRHALILTSEWDRSKLNKTVEFSVRLLASLDPARMFFLSLLGSDESVGPLSFDNVASRFSHIQVAQPIPRSVVVKQGNNGLRASPMGGWDDPVYERSIRALLCQVLDGALFAPVDQRPSLWARMRGRR